ncbi:LysR substrate-binding domain-containing protein [Myroides sp. LJL116]
MFDFRLKVFYTVANRSSFTKAAQDLGISQPAVTKHIKEIEQHYQIKLFNRGAMKISLTPAGELLLQYASDIFALHSKLAFDMQAIDALVEGYLRIGASTTISQYVLSPLLAKFRAKLTDVQVDITSDNSSIIEHLLLDNRLDVALVENSSRNPQIKYQDLVQDEIVLVCRTDNPYAQSDLISPKDLLKLSFLLREKGSGTLDIVRENLERVGIDIRDLTCEMNFSSTESIKMYLMHSNSFAFLSIHAILKELKYKELRVVDIASLKIMRSFSVIELQGQSNSIVNMFVQFAKSYNFKL